MAHVVFSGRLTTGGPRVWRTDKTGRFLLSGPAKENRAFPLYSWGDDTDNTLDLAVDLLVAVGTPLDLATELAPGFALGVLCALPREWELTAAQVCHWRDTVPTFDVVVLPAEW